MSPFSQGLMAFGQLLALSQAGVWSREARYLNVHHGGLLTHMIRDRGMDGWAYDPRGTNLPHHHGYTRLEDIPPGRMDVVTAFGLLETLVDPISFAREVRHVLAEDGAVVLSTELVFPDMDLEADLNLESETGRKVTFWSKPALAHFANQLGFRGVGYFPSTGGSIIFSRLNSTELEARLAEARAIWETSGFLAQAVGTWETDHRSRRTSETSAVAEAALAIRTRGDVRCAS